MTSPFKILIQQWRLWIKKRKDKRELEMLLAREGSLYKNIRSRHINNLKKQEKRNKNT